MINLTGALEKLQQWLNSKQIPFMVIEGVANFVWGEPRLTQDIDVSVQVPEEKFEELVADLSKVFQILPSDPADFIKTTRVLPLDVEGIRIDLILAGLEYEKAAIKRASSVELGGLRVRVCTAEDLIIHKAISERERDWEDIEGILLRQGSKLDRSYLIKWLEDFSRALERPSILERFGKMWSQLVKEYPD